MPFYPKAKHPHDAAFEQRGLGTPVQGKADDGQGQPVIRRIAEEIERVDGRTVWDRVSLDEAFDALNDEAVTQKNAWDGL